jgi:hypothetical protein
MERQPVSPETLAARGLGEEDPVSGGLVPVIPQPAPAGRIEHRSRLPPAAWVTSPSCGLAWVR